MTDLTLALPDAEWDRCVLIERIYQEADFVPAGRVKTFIAFSRWLAARGVTMSAAEISIPFFAAQGLRPFGPYAADFVNRSSRVRIKKVLALKSEMMWERHRGERTFTATDEDFDYIRPPSLSYFAPELRGSIGTERLSFR